MFQALIELMLGRFGRAFLAFYGEYQPIINGAVLVYGAILLYAHSSLRRLVQRMEAMILEAAQELGAHPDVALVHSRFTSRWRETQISRTAIIPTRHDLWLTRVDAARLPELLHIRPDFIRMTLHKSLGEPPLQSFRPAVYRAWEQHRRQLLIGLRPGRHTPEELVGLFEERLRERQQRARKERKKKR